jgi:hypothetical protein
LFFSSLFFSFSFFLFPPHLNKVQIIKKNSKSHKYYIKQFENYKMNQTTRNSIRPTSGAARTVAARGTGATVTGGAWIHAPPPMKVAETGGSGTSSSSLSPYAGGEGHRHLQQGETTHNSS